MRAVLPALALLLTLSLGACTNASIAEAYGRPDPFDWSYFEGSPEDVVSAIGETFQQSGIQLESVRTDDAGVIVTVSGRFDPAGYTQILVQETDEEDFSARAQVYPQGDALPRWLEAQISGRI
jgi:hypothetical protein